MFPQKPRELVRGSKLILNPQGVLYHIGSARISYDPWIQFFIFQPNSGERPSYFLSSGSSRSADGVKLKLEPRLNLLQKIKYQVVGEV